MAGAVICFVRTDAMANLMDHIAPAAIKKPIVSFLEKAGRLTGPNGRWGFSIASARTKIEMSGIGVVNIKPGLSIFARMSIDQFPNIAKAGTGESMKTKPVKDIDGNVLRGGFQLSLVISPEEISFSIYMSPVPEVWPLLRAMGWSSHSYPAVRKQLFGNIGNSKYQGTMGKADGPMTPTSAIDIEFRLTGKNAPMFTLNAGFSKTYASSNPLALKSFGKYCTNPNAKPEPTGCKPTQIGVQVKISEGMFLFGITIKNFAFAALDDSCAWIDMIGLTSATVIFTSQPQKELEFNAMEPPIKVRGIKAGLHVEGHVELSGMGSQIQSFGSKFKNQTSGKPAFIKGFFEWAMATSELTMEVRLMGIFPISRGFAFGGVTTDQGDCAALSFGMHMGASVADMTLKLAVCMTFWVELNNKQQAIQLEGMIEIQPASLTITFSLKMKTYLEISDMVTILPSFIMLGIGPETYSTGVPRSLGLGTGMILGKKDPGCMDERGCKKGGAIKWSLNIYAPNLPLFQFAFRAIMNHLDLLQVVRLFTQKSLGGMEKVLQGTFFDGLYLQLSTIPFEVTCAICICEPTVDVCPNGVVFRPGITFKVRRFGLFNLIFGGFYLELDMRPQHFAFNVSAHLEHFVIGSGGTKLEVGGYEEPKKLGNNNFIQADGSPKDFPDYTNLESINAIPWVPERAYATGPDHHELKRIHGTGPTATVRELDARRLELIEAQLDISASPEDCQLSTWSAWGKCTRSCGAGQQERSRSVAREAWEGGKPCPGESDLNQIRICNTQECKKKCSTKTSCGECTSTDGCGWCPLSGKCLSGTVDGPISPEGEGDEFDNLQVGSFCAGWDYNMCVEYSYEERMNLKETSKTCSIDKSCTSKSMTWRQFCAQKVFPDCMRAELAGCVKPGVNSKAIIQYAFAGSKPIEIDCVKAYPDPKDAGCWVRAPSGKCPGGKRKMETKVKGADAHLAVSDTKLATCHKVCSTDGCKPTMTNLLSSSKQWFTKTANFSEGCCGFHRGSCDLCCDILHDEVLLETGMSPKEAFQHYGQLLLETGFEVASKKDDADWFRDPAGDVSRTQCKQVRRDYWRKECGDDLTDAHWNSLTSGSGEDEQRKLEEAAQQKSIPAVGKPGSGHCKVKDSIASKSTMKEALFWATKCSNKGVSDAGAVGDNRLSCEAYKQCEWVGTCWISQGRCARNAHNVGNFPVSYLGRTGKCLAKTGYEQTQCSSAVSGGMAAFENAFVTMQVLLGYTSKAAGFFPGKTPGKTDGTSGSWKLHSSGKIEEYMIESRAGCQDDNDESCGQWVVVQQDYKTVLKPKSEKGVVPSTFKLVPVPNSQNANDFYLQTTEKCDADIDNLDRQFAPSLVQSIQAAYRMPGGRRLLGGSPRRRNKEANGKTERADKRETYNKNEARRKEATNKRNEKLGKEGATKEATHKQNERAAKVAKAKQERIDKTTERSIKATNAVNERKAKSTEVNNKKKGQEASTKAMLTQVNNMRMAELETKEAQEKKKAEDQDRTAKAETKGKQEEQRSKADASEKKVKAESTEFRTKSTEKSQKNTQARMAATTQAEESSSKIATADAKEKAKKAAVAADVKEGKEKEKQQKEHVKEEEKENKYQSNENGSKEDATKEAKDKVRAAAMAKAMGEAFKEQSVKNAQPACKKWLGWGPVALNEQDTIRLIGARTGERHRMRLRLTVTKMVGTADGAPPALQCRQVTGCFWKVNQLKRSRDACTEQAELWHRRCGNKPDDVTLVRYQKTGDVGIYPPGQKCVVQLPTGGCPKFKLPHGGISNGFCTGTVGASPLQMTHCGARTPLVFGSLGVCGDGCRWLPHQGEGSCLSQAKAFHLWCGMKQMTRAVYAGSNFVSQAVYPSPTFNEHHAGIGCYKKETLPLTVMLSPYVSIASCQALCLARDKIYFGITNGNRCVCGNTLNDAATLPDAKCDTTCHGVSLGWWKISNDKMGKPNMCGGSQSVNVYWVKTGTPGPVETFSVMSVDMKTIQIHIKPPVHDHGSRVKDYLIQMRSITSNKFHTFVTQKAYIDLMGEQNGKIGRPKVSPQTFELAGLLPGTEYAVRITPVNDMGVGEHSEAKSVKTKARLGGCPHVLPDKAIFNNTEPMVIHFVDPAQKANDVVSIVPMYDFTKQFIAPHEFDEEHAVKAAAACPKVAQLPNSTSPKDEAGADSRTVSCRNSHKNKLLVQAMYEREVSPDLNHPHGLELIGMLQQARHQNEVPAQHTSPDIEFTKIKYTDNSMDIFAKGTSSGTVTFDTSEIPPGNYEARLAYRYQWNCVKARAPVRLVGNFLHTKKVYSVHDIIQISYSVAYPSTANYISIEGEGNACHNATYEGTCNLRVELTNLQSTDKNASAAHGTVTVKSGLLKNAQYKISIIYSDFANHKKKVLTSDIFAIIDAMKGFAISLEPNHCTNNDGSFGTCDSMDVMPIDQQNPFYAAGLRGYWCWLEGSKRSRFGYTMLYTAKETEITERGRNLPVKCDVDPSLTPQERALTPERQQKTERADMMIKQALKLSQIAMDSKSNELDMKFNQSQSHLNALQERIDTERVHKAEEISLKSNYLIQRMAQLELSTKSKEKAEKQKVMEIGDKALERALARQEQSRKEMQAKGLEGLRESQQKRRRIENAKQEEMESSLAAEMSTKNTLIFAEKAAKQKIDEKAAELKQKAADEGKAKSSMWKNQLTANEKDNKKWEKEAKEKKHERDMKEYDAKSIVNVTRVAKIKAKKEATHARFVIRDFSMKQIAKGKLPFVEISASAKLQILGQYIAGVGIQVMMNDDLFDYKFWVNFFDVFQCKLHVWMKTKSLIPYAAGFKAEMQMAGLDVILQKIVDLLKGLVKAFNDRMNAAIKAVENAKDHCYRCHPPTYDRIKRERENRRIAALDKGLEGSQKAQLKALAAEDAAFAEAMKKADEEDQKKNKEKDEKSKADAAKKQAAIQAAAMVDIADNKRKSIEQEILAAQSRHTEQKQLVYQLNADYEKKATETWKDTDLKITKLEEMTAKQAAIESAKTQEENLSKLLLTSKENAQKISAEQQERLRKQLNVKEQEFSQKAFYQEKESSDKAVATKAIAVDERARKLLLMNTEINAKNVKQEDQRKRDEELKRDEEKDAKERTQKSVVEEAQHALVKDTQVSAGLVKNVKNMLLSAEALVNKAKCEIHDAATRLLRRGNYMKVIASQGARMFFAGPCDDNDPKCKTAFWAMNNVTEQYALFTHRAAHLVEAIESFKCDKPFSMTDAKTSLAQAPTLAIKDDCKVYAWSTLVGQKEQRWNLLPNSTAPDGSCIKSIGFTSSGRLLGVLNDGSLLSRDHLQTKWSTVKKTAADPKLSSVMGRTLDGSILGVSQGGYLYKTAKLGSVWSQIPFGKRSGNLGDVDMKMKVISVASGPGGLLYGIRMEDGCLYQQQMSKGTDSSGKKLPNDWRIVRTATHHSGICKMKSVSFMRSTTGLGELKLAGWDHYMYTMSVSPVGPDDITEPAFEPTLPGCWYRSLSGCPKSPRSTLWQEISLAEAKIMTKTGVMAELKEKRRAQANMNKAKFADAAKAKANEEVDEKKKESDRARGLELRSKAIAVQEQKNKVDTKSMQKLQTQLDLVNYDLSHAVDGFMIEGQNIFCDGTQIFNNKVNNLEQCVADCMGKHCVAFAYFEGSKCIGYSSCNNLKNPYVPPSQPLNHVYKRKNGAAPNDQLSKQCLSVKTVGGYIAGDCIAKVSSSKCEISKPGFQTRPLKDCTRYCSLHTSVASVGKPGDAGWACVPATQSTSQIVTEKAASISAQIKTFAAKINAAQLLMQQSADIFNSENQWLEVADDVADSKGEMDDGKSVIHMLPMRQDKTGVDAPDCGVCPGINICAWLSAKNEKVNVEADYIVGSTVGQSTDNFKCDEVGTEPEVVQNKRDRTMYIVERTQPSKRRCEATISALTKKCFGTETGDIEIRHNVPPVERVDPAKEKASKQKEEARMVKAKEGIIKRQQASTKRLQEQGVKETAAKKKANDSEKAAKAKVKAANVEKEKQMKAQNKATLGNAEKAGKAGQKDAEAAATREVAVMKAKFDADQALLKADEKKRKDEARQKTDAARAKQQEGINKKLAESTSKQAEVEQKFQANTSEQKGKVNALQYGRRNPTNGYIAQDMNAYCDGRQVWSGHQSRTQCAAYANHYSGHCSGHRCWFMHWPHNNGCKVYSSCAGRVSRWNGGQPAYLWEKINLLLLLPQEKETMSRTELEGGVHYKLGPLQKKKASCCVDMVTFNDLPKGESLQANLRQQIETFTEMWRKVLVVKGDMIDVREMATDGNHYTVMLKNVGANSFFDLLGPTSRKVVRDAETVEAYSNLLLEKFNANWPSITDAVTTNAVKPGKPVYKSYRKTEQLMLDKQKAIDESQKTLKLKVQIQKAQTEIKITTNQERTCNMKEYASCSIIKTFRCPNGVYPIRSNNVIVPLSCQDGVAMHVDGCPYGWHSENSWCYRVFPKGGANVTKTKVNRSMSIVDEDYVDFNNAKQHCKNHNAMLAMDMKSDSDRATILKLPGWRDHAKVNTTTGFKNIWIGRVTGIQGLNAKVPKSVLHKLPMKKNQYNVEEPDCKACPGINLCGNMQISNAPEHAHRVGPPLTGSPESTALIVAKEEVDHALEDYIVKDGNFMASQVRYNSAMGNAKGWSDQKENRFTEEKKVTPSAKVTATLKSIGADASDQPVFTVGDMVKINVDKKVQTNVPYQIISATTSTTGLFFTVQMQVAAHAKQEAASAWGLVTEAKQAIADLPQPLIGFAKQVQDNAIRNNTATAQKLTDEARSFDNDAYAPLRVSASQIQSWTVYRQQELAKEIAMGLKMSTKEVISAKQVLFDAQFAFEKSKKVLTEKKRILKALELERAQEEQDKQLLSKSQTQYDYFCHQINGTTDTSFEVVQNAATKATYVVERRTADFKNVPTTYHHAVMDEEGAITEADPSFRTMSVCKKRPLQSVLKAKQHGCMSRTSKYACPTGGNPKWSNSLAAALGDCTNCFAISFNQDAVERLNRVSFGVGDDGTARKLNMKFFMHHDQNGDEVFSDDNGQIVSTPQSDTSANHTYDSVSLVVKKGAAEMATIKTIGGPNLVVISVDKGKVMPTLNHLDFGYALEVHPLSIGACHAETQGCQHLYDGVNTHWEPPNVGPARVNFTFGHPTDIASNSEPKRNLNRLHLHYKLPEDCDKDACKKKYGQSHGGMYFYSIKINLKYQSGAQETINARFSDTVREATFVLNGALTSTVDVSFSVQNGQKLAMITEVMFWHALEFDSTKKQPTLRPSNACKPDILLNEDNICPRKKVDCACNGCDWDMETDAAGGGKCMPVKVTDAQSQQAKKQELAAVAGVPAINVIQRIMEVGMSVSPSNYVAVGGLFDAIKEAAQRIAMAICLGALGLVQGLLHLAKGIINGIAAVVIALLQAAIAAMGPHFFKINNLMIEASFDALAGLGFMFGFNIDMWLLGIHIGPWGFRIEFTIASLISKLWQAVTGGLKNM